MRAIERLERVAGRLTADLHALYLAYRDPRAPLHARIFAAFSPLDLIPLGVALAIRMIPAPVLAEAARRRARRPRTSRQTAWRPSSW